MSRLLIEYRDHSPLAILGVLAIVALVAVGSLALAHKPPAVPCCAPIATPTPTPCASPTPVCCPAPVVNIYNRQPVVVRVQEVKPN